MHYFFSCVEISHWMEPRSFFPFKSQYWYHFSPHLFLYISSKIVRESVKILNLFLTGDHFIYSYQLFSKLCMDIVRRKLMLVASETWRIKVNSLFSICADLDECRFLSKPCTDNNTECINSLGSFDCLCKKGFIEINRKCVCKYSDERTVSLVCLCSAFVYMCLIAMA